MELLDADLHSVIYGGRKLPPETCAKFLLQLCSGLIYMHTENGLIHRDVKPANIFISEQRLKLGDFGLTMEEHGPGASEICGTPEYMPYEIWNVARPVFCMFLFNLAGCLKSVIQLSFCHPKGLEVASRRQDHWGCGCILFEMMEQQLCFPEPPEASTTPPQCASRAWSANGHKLTTCYGLLLAQTCDDECLGKVAVHLDDWQQFEPCTPAAFERARRMNAAVSPEIRQGANQARKARRVKACLG